MDILFEHDGVPFNYHLKQRNGDQLVVFMPSLRPPGNTNLRFVNRLAWMDDYSCSCLFVTDPGLSNKPEIRGSWFQGSECSFAAERVAADISEIAKNYGCGVNKTILYGSSQGGFAAMAVAVFLPEVIVVAECPQIDVRQFTPLKNDVDQMAKHCYNVNDARNIDKKFTHRLDLSELYALHGAAPRGNIVLRASDKHHITVQLAHFRRRHPATLPEIIIDDSDNPQGHTAIDRKLIKEIITGHLAAA